MRLRLSNADCNRLHSLPQAFTLIELLVVVAIIGMLIAILVPSLSQARERARRLKCLTHLRSLVLATHLQADDHNGFAQLAGDPSEWPAVDSTHSKYRYSVNDPLDLGKDAEGYALLAWPVALAPYLGLSRLKVNNDYVSSVRNSEPGFYMDRFGRIEQFLCPSDPFMVGNVYFPAEMYCNLSYAANEDVFGITNPYNGEGQPWRYPQEGDMTHWENAVGDTGGSDRSRWRGWRLEGRLEQIYQPSTVVLYTDGGPLDKGDDQIGQPQLLITNGQVHGPFLENYEAYWGRLPHFRHDKKGGLNAGMTDGSAIFMTPVDWTDATSGGTRHVKKYSAGGVRARVSPFPPGALCPNQP